MVGKSVVTRGGVAKGIGTILGALAYFLLIDSLPLTYVLGLWLWMIALGGVVAATGPLRRHPFLPGARPGWAVRGAISGFWMGLLLVLLAPAEAAVIVAMTPGLALSAPWWLVLDAVILGLVMDWAATKAGGEGGDALM